MNQEAVRTAAKYQIELKWLVKTIAGARQMLNLHELYLFYPNIRKMILENYLLKSFIGEHI